jgi:hypothetical protein
MPMRGRAAAMVLAGALASALAGGVARAQGQAVDVPTRAGVTTSVYWAEAPGARATVLLFPGGDGGFGRVEGGRATGRNFLVRAVPLFLARGMNVAVFGRPSDKPELDYADRVAEPHLADVERVLEHLRTRSGAPVWLVGTSRGSVSATAAAIRLQGRVAGAGGAPRAGRLPDLRAGRRARHPARPGERGRQAPGAGAGRRPARGRPLRRPALARLHRAGSAGGGYHR